MTRPARRHYTSDARCEAVDGFCVEKRVSWRYDLPRKLATEPKRKADLGETCTVAINMLQLLETVVTSRVMIERLGYRSDAEWDRIPIQRAVSWFTRYGGARNKWACLLMRMLGRLELTGEWNPTANHISGVRNTLADDISRWPRSAVADKVKELTNSNEWSEQDIGSGGAGIFDLVLQTKNILTKLDDFFLEHHDTQCRT